MSLDINKQKTIETYELNPEYYASRFDGFYHFHQASLERFLAALKPKSTVLDLGSGGGTYALKIQEAGHNVLCLDNSKAMLNICRQRGLAGLCMDLEDLRLHESFDAAWAMASLIHIPKTRLKQTLQGIRDVMEKQGILYIGAHEGRDDGLIEERNFPGMHRHFSAFVEGEMEEIISGVFKLEQYWKKEGANNVFFLNYIVRKE